MKKFCIPLLFLGFITVMGLSSCSKANECEGDCLFTGKEIKAEVVYLNCFGQYGLTFSHPRNGNRDMIGVPTEMSKDFEVEGTKVVFDGGFFRNELTPDPNFTDVGFIMGDVFQVEIWKISGTAQ